MKEEGREGTTLLCFVPSSVTPPHPERERRGSFYASVARLEGIFSPSFLPSFLRSDREERIPPCSLTLLTAPATTIKFSFRREAIKTERGRSWELCFMIRRSLSVSPLPLPTLFKKPYVLSSLHPSALFSTSPFPFCSQREFRSRSELLKKSVVVVVGKSAA